MAEGKTLSNCPSRLANYAKLFERLIDPTFLIDKETLAILEVNPICEQVLGIPPTQLVGTSFTHWISAENQKTCEKALRITRRRYHPFQFELQWRIPVGRPLVTHTVACVLSLSDNSEIIQIVAKDITREREAEQKAALYYEKLRKANEELEALSITDEMTGLNNFRHFNNRLKVEHERCMRYGMDYAIVFCDLDNFKHYNDTNGHPAGDELLRQIAAILKSTPRATDLVARYGGEEFAILCSHSTCSEALVLAERLRMKIESHPFPHSSEQPLGKVSMSVGVASFPLNGQTPEEVLAAADQALYESKKNGRNRVTLSKRDGTDPSILKAS